MADLTTVSPTGIVGEKAQSYGAISHILGQCSYKNVMSMMLVNMYDSDNHLQDTLFVPRTNMMETKSHVKA